MATFNKQSALFVQMMKQEPKQWSSGDLNFDLVKKRQEQERKQRRRLNSLGQDKVGHSAFPKWTKTR